MAGGSWGSTTTVKRRRSAPPRGGGPRRRPRSTRAARLCIDAELASFIVAVLSAPAGLRRGEGVDSTREKILVGDQWRCLEIIEQPDSGCHISADRWVVRQLSHDGLPLVLRQRAVKIRRDMGERDRHGFASLMLAGSMRQPFGNVPRQTCTEQASGLDPVAAVLAIGEQGLQLVPETFDHRQIRHSLQTEISELGCNRTTM